METTASTAVAIAAAMGKSQAPEMLRAYASA